MFWRLFCLRDVTQTVCVVVPHNPLKLWIKHRTLASHSSALTIRLLGLTLTFDKINLTVILASDQCVFTLLIKKKDLKNNKKISNKIESMDYHKRNSPNTETSCSTVGISCWIATGETEQGSTSKSLSPILSSPKRNSGISGNRWFKKKI